MQTSFSDLEYAAKKKVTRRDRFLAEIESITPWAALVGELEEHYSRGGGRGRPPIGLERMLRMYVVQQCFGLSDESIEDAIYDSQAIRRFVGVDLAREAAPDATTLRPEVCPHVGESARWAAMAGKGRLPSGGLMPPKLRRLWATLGSSHLNSSAFP